jgi:arylsulfatase A-like enzyme
VVGRRAQIYFPPAPDPAPADLIAECHPFQVPGGPPQRLLVRLRDRKSAPVELAPGWQTVRVPLPEGVPGAGLTEAWLVFDHARAPAAVGVGEDRRKLAAACRRLAVVPRHVVDSDTILAGSRLDLEQRRLILAPSTALGIPLRPGSEVRLRLGKVDQHCDTCELRLELAAGAGVDVLWQGPAAAAAGLDLTFPAPAARYGKLRLRLLSAAGGQEQVSSPGVEIELGEPFLVYRSGGRRRGPPHAFLYLIDTLRADALEPYGSERPSSPRILEFARSAVVYQRAWATSTWTLPSIASVLTGVLPSRHGAMTGTRKVRAAATPTLASEMTRRGYRTVGISQSYVGGPAFGLDQGFEAFFLSDRLNSPYARSQEIRGFLVQWLLAEARSDQPLLVYAHTVDPHAPYSTHPPYDRFANEAPGALAPERYQPLDFQREGLGADPAEVAHLRALYDGEVLHADEQFGRFVELLEYLGLADRALIALWSDHGEEFGEHGGFDHGRTLYEELLRVPLIVRFPGRAGAGEVRQRFVSLLDLPATVLALSGGVPGRLRLDGRPLRIRKPPPIGRPRALFAELHVRAGRHRAAVDYRALGVADQKCIENRAGVDQFHQPAERWQFFDLLQDPRERSALDPASPAARDCHARLLREVRRQRTGGSDIAEGSDTDEETLDALRALGYLD